MSERELPKGWFEKPLGNLAEPRRGITYSAEMLEAEEGGLPYINMKSFIKGGGFNRDGTKSYAGFHTPADLVGERDLLIANTDVTAGDIVGVPALLPEHLASSSVLYSHHVTRLRLSDEVTVPFLYYLLCLPEYRAQMLRIARGTTVLMLDMQAIKRVSIRAPKLDTTQRLIAKILSTVDEAMEQTEALVRKLEQMKAGLMHDLFTRGVTPDGHLRPTRQEAPHLYHPTPLGWLPKEWRVVSLVQAVSQKQNAIVDGPFGSNLKTIHYRTSGVPVIQSGYVTSGFFHADEYHYVTEAHFQTQIRSKVDPGDIVMAKIGAQAGMCAVLPEGHPVSILAGNSLKISTDKTVLRRELLVAYLQRLYAVTGMSGVRTETAQPAISLGRLKKILIPLSSSAEQELATKGIAGMTEQLVTQSSHLAKLRQQKQGLMQDLLTGRVPV